MKNQFGLFSRTSLIVCLLFVLALVAGIVSTGGSSEWIIGLPLLGLFVPHGRNQVDAKWEFTKAIPAAGASNEFTAIDTESSAPGLVDNWEWELSIPALPALTDTSKSLTINVYTTAGAADSLTGLQPIFTRVRAGVTTTGPAAEEFRFQLPSTAKRYIRIAMSVTSAGGDSTAVSVTARARF